MEEKLFRAIDLHVHTPASSCYKKHENTNDEYLKIIKMYVDENIQLIAITDHNSFEGYKKIMEIKRSLIDYISELEKISQKSGIPSIDIYEYRNKYEMFNKITILPGIELEVNPGLHMLIIFNPTIKQDDLDEFLLSVGYDLENRGNEIPSTINVDVLQMYTMLEKYDCFVIAAHVDSNKGIYKSISGQYRAQVFQNDKLIGVQYLNQKNADQIKSLINNKEYKRNTPLAFIKASDFHGDFDCKPDIIHAELEIVNFDELKKALSLPEQKLSLAKNPEIETIIKNVIDLDYSLTIEQLSEIKSEAVDQKFISYICALLNNGFGYLIIGVTDNEYKNLLGVNNTEEELKAAILIYLKHFDTNSFDIHFSISKYNWSNRYIYIVKFTNIHNKLICSHDNKSYTLADNKTIKENSINDIVRFTENKIINNMKKYLGKNRNRIAKLSEELSLLHELNSSFDIFIKIDSCTINLIDVFDLEIIPSTNLDVSDKSLLGVSEYTIVLPHDGKMRNESAYMRLTPFGIKDELLDSEEKYYDECILITPSGCSYYIKTEHEYNILNSRSSMPILRLTINESFHKSITYEMTISWLKSSLLMFYLYAVHGSTNIYEYSILKSVPIIIDGNMSKSHEIINKINEVIDLEKSFLDITSEYCNADCDDCIHPEGYHESMHDKLDNEMWEFNDEVRKIMLEIDNHFYEEFTVNIETSETIEKFLKLNNFASHLYPENSKDDFYDEEVLDQLI